MEDESKNIGKCTITNELWANMLKAPVIVIDIPLEVRVKRLLRDYGEMPKEGLEDSIRKIERRLGNEAMKQALLSLETGDLAEVARINLRYYDKAYDHSLASKETKDVTYVSFETDDMGAISERLMAISQ
jgi:tRNA 2-selenouridine synthase